MASEEEVVRFIFNGANEMAELMYQLIKWALERREKGRDDGRRDPSKISGRIAPEDAASFAACVLSSSRRQNRRYDFDTFSVLRADRLSYF